MKVGDLIRVVQGDTLVPPWLGNPGVVIDVARDTSYEATTKPPTQSPFWRVLIDRKVLKIHESYLEVINESR